MMKRRSLSSRKERLTLSKGAQKEGPGEKANEQEEVTCTWLKKKKKKKKNQPGKFQGMDQNISSGLNRRARFNTV